MQWNYLMQLSRLPANASVINEEIIEEKRLNPGEYQLLLRTCSILCTRAGEDYGISVQIGDIFMERGLKDSVTTLLASGAIERESSDKTPALEAEIRMKFFNSTLSKTTTRYSVEAIKGTLNNICVYDVEGLLVPMLQSYNDVKEINLALNFLVEIWLKNKIHLDLALQDLTVIFKMAEIDLGLRFFAATLISDTITISTNASSMYLMLKSANTGDGFRQISNQFEMLATYVMKSLTDSQLHEEESRQMDLRLSKLKFSIQENERDPLLQFAQSSILGTRTSLELFIRSIKKSK